MKIKRIPVSKVQVAEYNPREDLQPDDPEYVAIQRSLERWGSVQPLVWNKRSGNLVGGHQRLKILMAGGATEVDVSEVDLDHEEEVALNIALNKIDGRWDQTKLFDALSLLDGKIDLTLTGFEADTLADLAKDLSRPIFEPNNAPTLANDLVDEEVTQEDMEAAQAKVESRFSGPKKTVKDVTCPHCGKDFGLGT